MSLLSVHDKGTRTPTSQRADSHTGVLKGVNGVRNAGHVAAVGGVPAASADDDGNDDGDDNDDDSGDDGNGLGGGRAVMPPSAWHEGESSHMMKAAFEAEEGHALSPAQVYGRGKHSVMWMSLAKQPRTRRIPQHAIDRLLLGPNTDTVDATLTLPKRTHPPNHDCADGGECCSAGNRRLSQLEEPYCRGRRSLSSPSPQFRPSTRSPSPVANRTQRWPHRPLCHHLAASIREWALEAGEGEGERVAEDVPASISDRMASQMFNQEDLLALNKGRALSVEAARLAPTMRAAFLGNDHRRLIRAFDRLLCHLTINDVQWFLGMQRTTGTIAGLPPPCWYVSGWVEWCGVVWSGVSGWVSLLHPFFSQGAAL